MAACKFQKGSEIWMMFMDFWKICQEFWSPEESDDYWDKLIDNAHIFAEKYKTVRLAEMLIKAFVDCQEQEYRAKRK